MRLPPHVSLAPRRPKPDQHILSTEVLILSDRARLRLNLGNLIDLWNSYPKVRLFDPRSSKSPIRVDKEGVGVAKLDYVPNWSVICVPKVGLANLIFRGRSLLLNGASSIRKLSTLVKYAWQATLQARVRLSIDWICSVCSGALESRSPQLLTDSTSRRS
jgi:hypothetical protein